MNYEPTRRERQFFHATLMLPLEVCVVAMYAGGKFDLITTLFLSVGAVAAFVTALREALR